MEIELEYCSSIAMFSKVNFDFSLFVSSLFVGHIATAARFFRSNEFWNSLNTKARYVLALLLMNAFDS